MWIPRSIHAEGCREARSKRTTRFSFRCAGPVCVAVGRDAQIVPMHVCCRAPPANPLRRPTIRVFSCSKETHPSLIRLGRIPSNPRKHGFREGRQRQRQRQRLRQRQRTERKTGACPAPFPRRFLAKEQQAPVCQESPVLVL